MKFREMKQQPSLHLINGDLTTPQTIFLRQPMSNPLRFLMIDDDPLNNFLNRAILGHIDNTIEVESFKDPEEALRYMESSYLSNDITHTIVMLDINLPRMSGWEFVEKFKKEPEDFRSCFDIYIFCSSIDGRDKTRVASNPVFKGFIQKPFEKELAKEIVASHRLQPVSRQA
jgi:CheY-like chemotaxis protein